MTSEVMEHRMDRAHCRASKERVSAMRNRWMVFGAVWAVFSLYTVEVAIKGGPLGFLTLHLSHAWGLQVLLDLALALLVALWGVAPRAKAAGVPVAPYVIATMCLGNVGLLAFVTHVEWARSREVTKDHVRRTVASDGVS